MRGSIIEVSAYPKKVTAKNAYEYWYMRMGGCTYKGKLPRGKKFLNAISRIKNHAFMTTSKSNRFITKRRATLLFDEVDGFPMPPYQDSLIDLLKSDADRVSIKINSLGGFR